MPTIESQRKGHILEYIETPKTHYYKLDGERVVGASTLAKCYPTPEGLQNWKMQQAAGYVFDACLKSDASALDKKQLITTACKAHKDAMSAAGDIGTWTHDYAFYHQTGQDLKLMEVKAKIKDHVDVLKIEECLKAFHICVDEGLGELLSAESAIASIQHKFAGKFDALYRKEGKIRLADYKTSKHIYKEHLIQLGAYAIALEEWLDVHVDEIIVLRFGKDGEFESRLVTDFDHYKEQAIRCVETYRFDKLTEEEFKK